MNRYLEDEKFRLKRWFDIFLSAFLLLLFFPIIILVYILQKFEGLFKKSCRGPFLYKETRISGGKPFDFYKIRTCKIAAYDTCRKQYDTVHTAIVEGDKSNFLKIGWIIKQVYLDEVPQLFNVLKGDMSLVGPRPKPVKEYENCLKEGNLAKKYIKAGLTGPFQSYKGHWTNGMGDTQMDMDYMEFVGKHDGWQIFFNDAKIIFRTAMVVLEHKGI